MRDKRKEHKNKKQNKSEKKTIFKMENNRIYIYILYTLKL